MLLAAAAGSLLWRSLDWPLVGDAATFHLTGNEVRLLASGQKESASQSSTP
jgi:hypothetical protein